MAAESAAGARVIYYWDEPADTIYLILIYRKVDQDDLTPRQLKRLSRSFVRSSSEEQ